MIIVISMAQPEEHDRSDGQTGLKRKFEKMTGSPVLSLHYTEASPEYVAKIDPQAIFITGFGYGWHTIAVPDLYAVNDLLHTTEVPVYGACGGHQLIGFCFNKDLRKVKQLPEEPLRKLRPGERDYGPISYNPGHYVARGFAYVNIVKPDPVFRGFRKRVRVLEAHYCEVKKLPPGFELLATSDECKIEAMKHQDKLLYGAQFHAEAWQEPYADGQRIMENFFRIAGLVR